MKPIALIVSVELARDARGDNSSPGSVQAQIVFLDLEKYWEAVKAGPPKP